MVMEKNEPKHWCFVVAVVGGSLLFCFSLLNIYFLLTNMHQNLIFLMSSILLPFASGGAIYISYSKIRQERYFILSLFASILCFCLGILATSIIAFESYIIKPGILEGSVIIIASITAIYISFIKLKFKNESYFITTLIAGFLCLIPGIIILASTLFEYSNLTPLILNIGYFIASITIIYVPSIKFRRGIIKPPWKE